MPEQLRKHSIIASAAMVVASITSLTIAQPDPGADHPGPGRGGPDQERPDGPPRPPRRLTPPVSLQGTVAGYNRAGRGEIDGFLLTIDGKSVQINLPPTIGSMVPTLAPVGKDLKIRASKMETQADHDVYEFRGLDDGQTTTAGEPSGGALSAGATPDKPGHVEGTIKSLNYARRGEVDGAVLDTGDFVHIGPREAKGAHLKVGDKLTADGPTSAMEDGHQSIDADKLNGTELQRPPRPRPMEDGKGTDGKETPPPPPQ